MDHELERAIRVEVGAHRPWMAPGTWVEYLWRELTLARLPLPEIGIVLPDDQSLFLQENALAPPLFGMAWAGERQHLTRADSTLCGVHSREWSASARGIASLVLWKEHAVDLCEECVERAAAKSWFSDLDRRARERVARATPGEGVASDVATGDGSGEALPPIDDGGEVLIENPWNGGPVKMVVSSDLTDAGPTVLLDVELTGVPLEEFELETGFAGIRFEGPPRQAKLHWNCGMSLDDARALRQALDDAIGD